MITRPCIPTALVSPFHLSDLVVSYVNYRQPFISGFIFTPYGRRFFMPAAGKFQPGFYILGSYGIAP